MKPAFFLFLTLFLPLAASAELAETYELADTGLITNTSIDIVEHDGGVWLATGKGVQITYDGGQTWLRYTSANGLVSENLSAIYSAADGRLWIGSNHTEFITDQNFTISDGVSYTPDGGDTWTQIDFSETGLDIPFVFGGNRQVFDITGQPELDVGRQWLFFSAFAGGLLASQDGGDSWRRIYASPADSIQFNATGDVPSRRNRYFSAVIDSSHTDTVMLWSGSASGVFQYIWVRPGDKLYSGQINALGVCDTCTDTTFGSLLIGGRKGLSRGRKIGGPFRSLFQSDGLPGQAVTAILVTDDRAYIGAADTLSGDIGFAYSDDLGQTLNAVSVPDVTTPIFDFEQLGSRIYMSAGISGLFASYDQGLTWSRILVDSADVTSGFNSVNAAAALGDTLFLGTDTGFAALYLDPAGLIDSNHVQTFAEDVIYSRRILQIEVQRYGLDTAAGTYDSAAVWSVHVPATATGTNMISRTVDGGANFLGFEVGVVSTDVGFIGDTVFVVGEDGAFYAPEITDLSSFGFTPLPIQSGSANIAGETILAFETDEKQMFLGTEKSLVVSHETDSTRTFTIYRGNADSLSADVVVNFTRNNTIVLDTAGRFIEGLTGDFIPAMGVQYRDGDRPRIWASGRPVSSDQRNGIAYARFDTDVDSTGKQTVVVRWRGVYNTSFAWNFGFNGDTVFAATDAGLMMKIMNRADSLDVAWDDTLEIITPEGVILERGTPVYAAKVIGNDLWVGTDDGTIRLDVATLTNAELFKPILDNAASDEVYSFPVPFRPGQGGEVDFHFTVPQAGNVTLEIYDFAMNLVARPIDGVYYPAGTYHGTGPSGLQGPTWDGRNGDGEVVAVGMYYFKVEMPSGDPLWGKIAVIP